MKLVIDANELFAGIITKGKGLQNWTLDILFSEKVELFAPLRLLVELERNEEEIKRKSGFSSGDFEAFISVVKQRIKFVLLEEFMDKISEAKKLAPHLKDTEYFALALKINCAIWSEEKSFKDQKKVGVFHTKDLIQYIDKNS